MIPRQAGPKNRALAHLLEALSGPIAMGRVAIDPRWRDNEEAVGLYLPDEPEVTAFVFTYAQPRDAYAVDLGYPDVLAATAAGMVLSREAIDLVAMILLLCTHFDLSEHV